MLRKIFTYLLILILGLCAGFLLGDFYSSNNLSQKYTCHDIARFHADYLLKNHIDAFNTDSTNPNRTINQRASDLNAALLRICNTSPKDLPCSSELKESTSELCK